MSTEIIDLHWGSPQYLADDKHVDLHWDAPTQFIELLWDAPLVQSSPEFIDLYWDAPAVAPSISEIVGSKTIRLRLQKSGALERFTSIRGIKSIRLQLQKYGVLRKVGSIVGVKSIQMRLDTIGILEIEWRIRGAKRIRLRVNAYGDLDAGADLTVRHGGGAWRQSLVDARRMLSELLHAVGDPRQSSAVATIEQSATLAGLASFAGAVLDSRGSQQNTMMRWLQNLAAILDATEQMLDRRKAQADFNEISSKPTRYQNLSAISLMLSRRIAVGDFAASWLPPRSRVAASIWWAFDRRMTQILRPHQLLHRAANPRWFQPRRPEIIVVPPEPDPPPEYIDLVWRRRIESRQFIDLYWDGPDIPMINNSVSVRLVATDAVLHPTSASLKLGAGDIAWTASFDLLSVDEAAMILPLDDLREVEITMNGYAWRIWIDNYSITERGGQPIQWSFSGASLTAQLAAPYATARHYQQPAEALLTQQIAQQELDFLGVNLEWTAANGLMPASTWSYQNQTPAEAIGALVEGVGALLTVSRDGQTLRVVPSHPHRPWQTWGTLDHNFSANEIFEVSRTRRQVERINRVIVMGETSGGEQPAFVRTFTLSSTAGDSVETTNASPLHQPLENAEAVALRQIAASWMTETGRFNLPLFPDREVRIGQTVSAAGRGRGRIVSIDIAAQASAENGVLLDQEIGVEFYATS